MNSLLVPSHQLGQITFTVDPTAVEKRDEAIANSQFEVQVVSCPEENETAIERLRDLTTIARNVEKVRKELKAPVTQMARTIDGLAEQFTAPITTEENRLKSLCAGYQRRLDDERRKAEAIAQKERERIAAEQRQKEIEAQKELQRMRAEATNQAMRDAADAQAKANLERIQQLSEQKQAELIQLPGPKSEQRPEGVRVARPWKWEVTDLEALYKARPDLVELVPRGRSIQDHIRNATTKGVYDANVAGLRVWQEVQIGVRT